MKNRDSGGGHFAFGVMVLTASTLIVKIIGLLLKIPMMNILGAEGMGYFNSAYEIYALLCVISTAGLPVALSIMVSSRYARRDMYAVRRVYRTALTAFFVLGAIGSSFMLLFGGRISEYIENENAYLSIIAIAPSLLFVCVSSAVRGYFQGLGKMLPTALSQLIEALCKLVLGVFFASEALRRGYGIAQAAAASVVGLSVGTLLSALFLIFTKAICAKRDALSIEKTKKERGVAKQLFLIAVPITLGSAIMSTSRIVDMTLILKRLLDIGYSSAGANEIFGSYTTLALPVFGLIPSLVTPISLALVPELSAARERGDRGRQNEAVRSSLRLTILFSMPASFGVAVYSRQILGLLFSRQSEAISVSAPLLSVLGISVMFSCLITTTNAILQAYSKTNKTIISMALGILVKAVSAYLLIGNASIGVLGAPISTLLCDISVTAINFYYIKKSIPRMDGVSELFARPFFASVAMICTSFAFFLLSTHLGASQSVAFIVAVLFAVVAYLVFAFLFGAIKREDMQVLPLGNRFAAYIWRKEYR